MNLILCSLHGNYTLTEEEGISSIAFVKDQDNKLQFCHRDPNSNKLVGRLKALVNIVTVMDL